MDDLRAATEALRDRIDAMLGELTAIRDQADALAKLSVGARGMSLGKAPEPAGNVPAAVIGEGTWLVGKQIQPGLYETATVKRTGGVYWKRLSGTSGDPKERLAMELVKGHAVVTIRSTDVAFETRGCTWTKIG